MALTKEQQLELESARSETFQTFRPTVPALENILGKAHPVLDHGFVRVVDYMGDDSAIVQAARVSYGKGTKTVNNDTGLIRYLLRHRHTTPFEMCEIKFHIKLPIFIARQWIRHRTANVNEYSARYSVLDKEFYIPEENQLAAQSSQNHQGRGVTLQGAEAAEVLQVLKGESDRTYDLYENLLNERYSGETIDESKQGLARELARMTLPLNAYTQWYWKVNLHNLLHFLSLRADSHAQYEIQAYANVMLDMVKAWVPAVHQAFEDYRMDSFSLSGPMKNLLADRLKGVNKGFEEYGLSKREWLELAEVMELEG